MEEEMVIKKQKSYMIKRRKDDGLRLFWCQRKMTQVFLASNTNHDKSGSP